MITHLLLFVLISFTQSTTCPLDVSGSYGDARETNTDSFAPLVGLACAGKCYNKASQWSIMAISHGNNPVSDTATCRLLCVATVGCQVWTYDAYAKSCRAMRALYTSPAIASLVPNTTTGKAICDDVTKPILPFPDSLTQFIPSDVDDACFRPGYMYGDGSVYDLDCSSPPPRAPLLSVHAPQSILDQGIAQDWWNILTYPNPNLNPSVVVNDVLLVPTPNNQPYSKAITCSKECKMNDNCGGFSFTHGVCLLRGKVYQPISQKDDSYVAIDTCRATNIALRSDSITGPGFEASTLSGTCTQLERTIPEPAGAWFKKCDVPRCTTIEDANGGDWLQWELDAPFPRYTKDFVFHPKNYKCFFPMYNRTEIRTLLGGENAPANNEAWVVVIGGSNSFGMGAAVMKAVHNSGGEVDTLIQNGDVWTGRGISKADSTKLNLWKINCVVDTIRHLDGTSTVRFLTMAECGKKGILLEGSGFSDASSVALTEWIKEMEQYATPGSIRVTHIICFLLRVYVGLAEMLGAMINPSAPFNKLLLWGQPLQRESARGQVEANTRLLSETTACNRPDEILCVVGTKYERSEYMAEQMKSTFPNSLTRLFDVSSMTKGGNYESQGGHRLQNHHLFHLQIMLNQWDLDYSGLTTVQRAKAIATKGCPEALTFSKWCHGASGVLWNSAHLCEFDRDPITPANGKPAFYVSRTAEKISSSGGGGEGNSGGTGSTVGSGICGDNVADFDVLSAIEGSSNKTFLTELEKEYPMLINSINSINSTDDDQDGEFLFVEPLSRLCKGRLWCGYETQAWGLGLGFGFVVCLWWTIKTIVTEINRDQGSEVTRLDKQEQSKAETKSKSSQHRKQRRASLDPGNGGRRSNNRSSNTKKNNNKNNSSNSSHRRQATRSIRLGGDGELGTVVQWSKPMSTATGERLTSLGPARFMASMHIVAGHLYQKSALGPMYLLSWGYTWVPWFFMLSGYVLMHARLNSRTPMKVDLPTTALWKRTSSIFPMYTVGVILDMLCFCARGTPLPDYHVLIAQSFLLQSWISYLTEKALQTHCWFLSAMVIYWICFGPAYRLLRRMSLSVTLVVMLLLSLLPWLAVIIPLSMDNLAFYKSHKTGSLSTTLDHVVVTLKFNPICYAHVFLFGMCLARFRRHVTRREDTYEVLPESRTPVQFLLLIPFRAGAVLGYLSLLVTFLSLREASAAKAKISARLGLLMPLQGLILLGLSPFRGLQINPSKIRYWFQQTGSDPIANLFRLAPGWIGDVSYAQYVLQILAYTVWPVKLNVFGRFGWVPFFLFLQSISFFCAMVIQTPARKAWMRPIIPKQGRWMLVWPCLLAVVLCVSKGIQSAVFHARVEANREEKLLKENATLVLPEPYIAMNSNAFWETEDSTCANELYGSNTHVNVRSKQLSAIDVKFNWTFVTNNLDLFNGNIINPSLLLIPETDASSSSSVTASLYTFLRAARIHRMEETSDQVLVDATNAMYLNGSLGLGETITEITNTWHSGIVGSVLSKIEINFNSWDPIVWNIDGKQNGLLQAMQPASILTNRLTKELWNTKLCRIKPTYVLENKTLIYKIVTDAEDPKLFQLPQGVPQGVPHGVVEKRNWAMLFSSLPPASMIKGDDDTCDDSKKSKVQMYIADGVSELFTASATSAPSSSSPAGVYMECSKKEMDEKNWIPFTTSQQATHFVYSISPHVILTGRPADGTCIKTYTSTSFQPLEILAEKIGASKIRGSATALKFGLNRYLGLIHTKTKIGRGYTTMAYMFSDVPPYEIVAISRPLPLSGSGLAFPSGLTVLNQEKKILITFGVADAQSRIMVLSRESLRDLFIWRGCRAYDSEWWMKSFPNDLLPSLSVSTNGFTPACQKAATDESNNYKNIFETVVRYDTLQNNKGYTTEAVLTSNYTTMCINCNNDLYCPSESTEVLYSCPPNWTPVRKHLSIVALNLCLLFFGSAILIAAVLFVQKWKIIQLEKEYNEDPSVRDNIKRSNKGSKTTKRALQSTKTKGIDWIWFYVSNPDGTIDASTGTVETLGPYSRNDLKEALTNGDLYSWTSVTGTDAQGNTTSTSAEWVQIHEISGLPVSQALEWYSLGEDGITEGPFQFSILKGWYDSGAVVRDLLISNGTDDWQWKEVSEVMSNEEDEMEVERLKLIERKKAEKIEKIEEKTKKTSQDNKNMDSTGKKMLMPMLIESIGINTKIVLSSLGIRKKKKRKKLTKEEKMQAMWWIQDHDSGTSIGPYQGSMLHAWLYWKDLTKETMVGLVEQNNNNNNDSSSSSKRDEEEGGDDITWRNIVTIFGEEVLKADDENGGDDVQRDRVTSACCACPCISSTNDSDSDSSNDSEDEKQDTENGIELISTATNQNNDGAFNQYKKTRNKSGAFSPNWVDNVATSKGASINDTERNWNNRSDWMEHVNEEYGRYYYYNLRSKKTQWEAPTLENGFGYVPCEWRIQYDDATERIFFSNRINGQVVWNIKDGGSFSQANPMAVAIKER